MDSWCCPPTGPLAKELSHARCEFPSLPLPDPLKQNILKAVLPYRHPGAFIPTDIGRDRWYLDFAVKWLLRPFTKSQSQGAATTVHCALLPADELQGLVPLPTMLFVWFSHAVAHLRTFAPHLSTSWTVRQPRPPRRRAVAQSRASSGKSLSVSATPPRWGLVRRNSCGLRRRGSDRHCSGMVYQGAQRRRPGPFEGPETVLCDQNNKVHQNCSESLRMFVADPGRPRSPLKTNFWVYLGGF